MEQTLYEVFEALADPREASGRRHPLAAILTQASVAMLAGARSLQAIAQFGRDRGEGFAAALGYRRPVPPCKATFHLVFKALDAGVFEEALGRWLQGRAGAGWRAVSVDGKTLRGATGEQLPGVHLLAAYAHEAKTAIGQMPVAATTNEHKAALEWLGVLPLAGQVVVGDAAFCQRDLSRKVLQKKGLRLEGQGQPAQAEGRHPAAAEPGDVPLARGATAGRRPRAKLHPAAPQGPRPDRAASVDRRDGHAPIAAVARGPADPAARVHPDLTRQADEHRVPLRRHAARPEEALAMIHAPPTEN